MVSRKVEEDGALRCVITEVTFKHAQRKMCCPGHTSPTHPGACIRTPAALRPLGPRVINTHVSTPRPVRAAGSEMKTTTASQGKNRSFYSVARQHDDITISDVGKNLLGPVTYLCGSCVSPVE